MRAALNGERRGRDQTALAKDEVSDDARLLKEILFQIEEKISRNFDATCPGKHNPCPDAKKDVRPGAKKRPAPKYNKVLKEAEKAALQKPMTPNKYRQLVKEHLEILPFMARIMDKNGSR